MEINNVGEGLQLRNFIRGKGYRIEDAAGKMGMTRQNLSKYFYRDKLPPDILQLAEVKLHFALQNESSKRTTTDTKHIINIATISEKDIFDMGTLLKISTEELEAMLRNEADLQRRNLIAEVMNVKMKLEYLQRENDLLRENIAYLKQKNTP